MVVEVPGSDVVVTRLVEVSGKVVTVPSLVVVTFSVVDVSQFGFCSWTTSLSTQGGTVT